MQEIDLTNWSPDELNGDLRTPKKQMTVRVALIITVFYTPLVTIHYLNNLFLVSALNALVIIGFWLYCFRTLYQRQPISDTFAYTFLLLLILSATIPIFYIGQTAIFWVFPIGNVLFFLLPIRKALLINLLMASLSFAFSLKMMAFGDAIRYTLALCICIYLMANLTNRIRTMQQELRDSATTDPMTGAYNRRLMHEEINAAISRYNMHEEKSFIAMLDLDNFKTINDTLGHDVGDRAIITLVSILQKHCGDQEKVFRLGGDEMLMLLKSTDAQAAFTKMDAIREEISKNNKVNTTCSMGLASVENAVDTSNWLRIADEALYTAKEQGRNKVIVNELSAEKG